MLFSEVFSTVVCYYCEKRSFLYHDCLCVVHNCGAQQSEGRTENIRSTKACDVELPEGARRVEVGLIVHHDVKTLTSSACTAGRLKMQDWKMRDRNVGVEMRDQAG